jgi:hypothetical protein
LLDQIRSDVLGGQGDEADRRGIQLHAEQAEQAEHHTTCSSSVATA